MACRCGENRELLARDEVEYKFGVTEAERFAETLARRLGLDPGYVMPAFEDPFYHLHQERQLPMNVDPAKNQLEDPLERERIRKCSSVDWIRRWAWCCRCSAASGKSGPEWQTGLWMLRGEQLVSAAGRFAGGPAAAAAEFAVGGVRRRTGGA